MNRQQIEKEFPTMAWHFERSHGFEEMLETEINKLDIQALLELGRNYENIRKYYYKLMNEWERSGDEALFEWCKQQEEMYANAEYSSTTRVCVMKCM